MIQDYKLQLDSLLQFKRHLVTLIEDLNQLDKFYANSIESSHQNGVTVQMYERLKGLNMERIHSEFRKLVNNIETNDLSWIKSLEDGLEAVINVAGASVPVSGTASGLHTSHTTTSAASTKAEQFRKGTQKVVAKAAIASAAAPGRDENQRNIHADYFAAFMAHQKSR